MKKGLRFMVLALVGIVITNASETPPAPHQSGSCAVAALITVSGSAIITMIICDEAELQHVRQCIRGNPPQWALDGETPQKG